METQNYIASGLGRSHALGQALKYQPVTLILMVINVAASTFIVGLWGYHTFLLLTNQTTNEQLKKTWKLMSGNPYKLFFNNFYDLKKVKMIVGTGF